MVFLVIERVAHLQPQQPAFGAASAPAFGAPAAGGGMFGATGAFGVRKLAAGCN
jgi:hypothetical protein